MSMNYSLFNTIFFCQFKIIQIGDITKIVSVKNGIGEFNLGILNVGDYNISVNYYENENYNSNSNTTTFKVTGTGTNFNIIANSTNITYGENIKITQKLPSDATGTITIRVGDYVDTVRIVGGLNNIIVPNLGVGIYAVNVTYNGNDKYNPLTEEVNFYSKGRQIRYHQSS